MTEAMYLPLAEGSPLYIKATLSVFDRETVVTELANRAEKKPITAHEAGKLFGTRLVGKRLRRDEDEDEGECGCPPRNEAALEWAIAALHRRDYREALYQIGRAIPELSDLSYLADRLTIAPGA